MKKNLSLPKKSQKPEQNASPYYMERHKTMTVTPWEEARRKAEERAAKTAANTENVKSTIREVVSGSGRCAQKSDKLAYF